MVNGEIISEEVTYKPEFDYLIKNDDGTYSISKEPTNICQFAAAKSKIAIDIENLVVTSETDGSSTVWDTGGFISDTGPNQLTWHYQAQNGVCFPETVVDYEDEDKKEVTVVGIGDYSFANTGPRTWGVNTNIPKTYEFIGKGAFAGTFITDITLEGIKYIGDYAFAGSVFLKPNQLNLESAEYIGDYAFYCAGIDQTMTNPLDLRKAKYIGEGAFKDFMRISSLVLGTCEIGKDAFVSLKNANFTSLTIDGSIKAIGKEMIEFKHGTTFEYIKVTSNGHIGEILANAFQGAGLHTGLIVEEGGSVDKIGDYAFATEYNVEGNITNDIYHLDLGTVKEIGEYAFKDCSFYTAVEGSDPLKEYNLVIPAALEEMGEGAFSECHNIKKIEFEDGALTEIPEKAFFITVESVEEIRISDNIETIGDYAFTKYNYKDDNEHFRITHDDDVTNLGMSLKKLYLGKNLTKIGNYAFAECTDLEELVIPDNVTTIGDYAFCHCWMLCPLTIGKSVESIGDFAFFMGKMDAQCGQTKLVLPASLKTVGHYAFTFNNTVDAGEKDRDNGQVTDVYVWATTPPEMGYDKGHDACTFGRHNLIAEGENYWEDYNYWMYRFLCLHVPKGSYSAYVNDEHWKHFSCIMDDLIDKADDKSVRDIVGYVFMQLEPNVSEPLSVFLNEEFAKLNPDKIEPGEEDGDNTSEEDGDNTGKRSLSIDTWKIVGDDEGVISVTNDKVTALDFGQRLVLGYDKHSNSYSDKDGSYIPETMVGAVMVFVCPTITLVYDLNNPAGKPKGVKARAGEEDGGESDYDALTSDLASYQHRTIYNSYPKVEVNTPTGVKISAYEKAGVDNDGKYIGNTTDDTTAGLTEIDSSQLVGQGTEASGNYIVPMSSVTENRVIKLSMAQTTNNPNLVSVADTDVAGGIRISTFGRTMHIDGAADTDRVDVYDLEGRLVKSTFDKTFGFESAGIYVVKVGDTTFKANVW